MTNKPMLSVELRAFLEGVVKLCAVHGPTYNELRALLDKPAAQQQGSNPGWPDPLESTLAKEIINNPAAFDLAIRDLFDKLCREIQAGRYYRRFSGSEPMEFTSNQGEPVAWASPKSLEVLKEVGWMHVGAMGGDTAVPLFLRAEQPAPVAVVMPERKVDPGMIAGLTSRWVQGWNEALDEVARLNGVKL